MASTKPKDVAVSVPEESSSADSTTAPPASSAMVPFSKLFRSRFGTRWFDRLESVWLPRGKTTARGNLGTDDGARPNPPLPRARSCEAASFRSRGFTRRACGFNAAFFVSRREA